MKYSRTLGILLIIIILMLTVQAQAQKYIGVKCGLNFASSNQSPVIYMNVVQSLHKTDVSR